MEADRGCVGGVKLFELGDGVVSLEDQIGSGSFQSGKMFKFWSNTKLLIKRSLFQV